MSNISISNGNESKLLRVGLITHERVNQLSSILAKLEGGHTPAGRVISRALDALERELNIHTPQFRYPLSQQQQQPAAPISPEEASALSKRLAAIPPKEGRDFHVMPANDLPLAPGAASAPAKRMTSADRASLAEFEIFWKTYPRKVGKAAAAKAWLRAIHRPDLDTVIRALVWQMQHGDLSRAEPQFIPHASTWINQERWADERPQVQTQLQKDEAKLQSALEMAAVLDKQREANRRGVK